MSDEISAAHNTAFPVEAITPDELKLKREEQTLHIRWRDGRLSVYPAVMLRRQCPCATCRTERDQKKTELLPILKSDPGQIKLANAKLVGTYAIQLIWSDGHDAGIFDYKYLRSLDRGV